MAKDYLGIIQEIVDRDDSPDKRFVQLIEKIDWIGPNGFPDIVAVLILKVAALEAEVKLLRKES